MRRREGENQDLVSVSIDLSHEYQVQQKWFSALLSPKIPTVNITSTSNSDPMSVDNTYDEDFFYQKQQLRQLNDHLLIQHQLI